MTDRVDTVVIGAGVIGLAIARELALAGREVVVLERNAGIGEETSSRNSEVIHAGIYYPAGSLKARLCVAGRELLYAYCERHQVPHARTGKLIVAVTEAQRPELATLARMAAANGVDNLVAMDRKSIAAREPELEAAAGLWSPSTGIVDSHALMLSLQAELEAADGHVALHTEVESLAASGDGMRLTIDAGGERSELVASLVINAAGLRASTLSAGCSGLGDYATPHTFFAKGNYFGYAGQSPFKHLVYPLPVDGGLGVHVTLDLAGRARFGPDVEWVDTIDYSVDAARAEAFYEAIRDYWPGLPDGSLTPAYAGVRPKLARAGDPVADFRIDTAYRSAAATLIALYGIESPGLTASLAIAAEVRSLAEAD